MTKAAGFGALALVLAVGGAYFSSRHRVHVRQLVEAQIVAWPEGPRLTAEVLMERYGPPDSITPEVATWLGRGVWKRIVVHGDEPYGYFEQTVGYRARPEAAAALSEFGHGVRLDLDNDEVTATSNHEGLNYLALNMADEVAAGKRSAREARESYVRLANLSVSGKSSPYMDRLLFAPYRPRSEVRWGKEAGY